MAGGWLHRGAIICPSCHEVCGEYLQQRGEECRIREEAPPANKYPRDDLHCSGNIWHLQPIILLTCLFILTITKMVDIR